MRSHKVLVGIVLGLIAGPALGQTAGMLSFEGFVKDAGDDVTSGLGLSVTNGIVATKFGPIHASSFDGSQRWLELRVNATALPRVELVTAPAVSEQVNRLGSATPAIEIDSTGDVGTATPGLPRFWFF